MTWFTDEQVREAAITLYGVDIGFPASMKKIAAMFDALPDDEPAWYLAKARAALSAVNPYEWRPIAEASKDGGYITCARFGESNELLWVKHSRWMTAEEAAEEDGGNADDYEPGWTDGEDEGDYCFPTYFTHLFPPPVREGDK